MDCTEKEILEEYAYKASIYMIQYNCIEKMWDKNCANSVVNLLGEKRVILYGGGALGVQMYMLFKNRLNINCIVDKNCKLKIDLEEDINVISIDRLAEIYEDELVVITPLLHGKNIENELSVFVPHENIYFINELFK